MLATPIPIRSPASLIITETECPISLDRWYSAQSQIEHLQWHSCGKRESIYFRDFVDWLFYRDIQDVWYIKTPAPWYPNQCRATTAMVADWRYPLGQMTVLFLFCISFRIPFHSDFEALFIAADRILSPNLTIKGYYGLLRIFQRWWNHLQPILEQFRVHRWPDYHRRLYIKARAPALQEAIPMVKATYWLVGKIHTSLWEIIDDHFPLTLGSNRQLDLRQRWI